MNEPEKLVVETESITAATVRQSIYFPADEEKIPLLIGLLSRSEGARTMVFVNTKAFVERVARALETRRLPRRRAVRRRAAEEARDRCSTRSRRASSRSWSPPTSPRAACTSTASRTSTTTTCRSMPRTTCTASAAPRAWAPRATRSASPASATRMGLPDIEAYIEQKIPVEPVTSELLTAMPRAPRAGRAGRGRRRRARASAQIFREAREARAAEDSVVAAAAAAVAAASRRRPWRRRAPGERSADGEPRARAQAARGRRAPRPPRRRRSRAAAAPRRPPRPTAPRAAAGSRPWTASARRASVVVVATAVRSKAPRVPHRRPVTAGAGGRQADAQHAGRRSERVVPDPHRSQDPPDAVRLVSRRLTCRSSACSRAVAIDGDRCDGRTHGCAVAVGRQRECVRVPRPLAPCIRHLRVAPRPA